MGRRRISILAGAAIAAATLWGCGKEAGAELGVSNGKYTEMLTVDVYDEYANYQGIQSGWFAKVIKDRFCMELNILAPNVAGSRSLYQTRLAAGNLGDLVLVNTSNGKVKELVEFGLIMDCSDLIEGKRIMEEYGKAVAKTNERLTGEEDKIYVFPKEVSSRGATEPREGMEPTFGPYIRWDYYAKLGYPRMRNLAEFLDVLEKMQAKAREEEESEDIYAISLFRDWDNNMMNNAKQIACMYGYDELGFVMAKADGSDYQDILADGSMYMRSLEFLYKANQRGLIDPDSFSQGYSFWTEKYKDGKVLYCPWPWVGQSMYNTMENRNAGRGFMFAPVEDMQIFVYGNCPEGNAEEVLAIGSGAEEPERLADFIDWLYSPEGIELNGQANGAAGIQGLTWEINEDGKPELTEFGKRVLPSGEMEVPEEYGGGSWQDGISALNFEAVSLGDVSPETGQPYDYMRWETTISASDTALDRDWRVRMNADTTMEYLEKNEMRIIAPGSGYATPREDSDITIIRSQCKDRILESSWQMVFAEDDEEFSRLKKELREAVKGLGYEEVLEVDWKNAQAQTTARMQCAAAYPAAAD